MVSISSSTSDASVWYLLRDSISFGSLLLLFIVFFFAFLMLLCAYWFEIFPDAVDGELL